MKNTKRALLLSALALVMCVAMLIGSTFAWFTDSASTAVNTIQSGTLKIDIASDKDGVNSLKGQTIDFVAKDGTTNVLWEPNCTFNTEPFYIVNEGNLALKFQFAVTGATGDLELLDVIDFTAKVTVPEIEVPYGGFSILMENYELDLFKGFELADGSYVTDYTLKPGEFYGPIVISGHMDKDAGNQYQDKTVSGLAINLVATQVPYEEDSIDGTYDADVKYPTIVKTIDELQTALDKAVDGDVISLANDVSGTIEIVQKADKKIIVRGNGNTLTGFVTINGGSAAHETAGIVFENLRFVADDASAFGQKACIRLGVSGDTNTRYTSNVTIKNCYFDINDRKVPAIESYTGGDKNLTIIDCTVTSRMHSFLQIPNVNGLVIDNCKIYSKNGINLNSSSNVEIKNCEIKTNGYCVRIGATSGGDSGKVTLTKNYLETDNSEGDATIIVRSAAIEKVDLVVTGNTIKGATPIKGIKDGVTKYTESGNTWIFE